MNTPEHGKWKKRAKNTAIGVMAALALLKANDIFDIVHGPKVEGRIDASVSPVKIYKVWQAQRACGALAEAGVTVDGSVKAKIGFLGINHTETMIQKVVKVDGDFAVCATGEDINLVGEVYPSNPKKSHAMVTISQLEADRPRLDNLGAYGAISGQGDGWAANLLGLMHRAPVDEAQFVGFLQNIGQNVLGQGLCQPEVIQTAETGLTDFYKDMAAGLGIPRQNTTVEFLNTPKYLDVAPKERAQTILGDLYGGKLPKDFHVNIAQAVCSTAGQRLTAAGHIN